jgi:hypothetical protein
MQKRNLSEQPRQREVGLKEEKRKGENEDQTFCRQKKGREGEKKVTHWDFPKSFCCTKGWRWGNRSMTLRARRKKGGRGSGKAKERVKESLP